MRSFLDPGWTPSRFVGDLCCGFLLPRVHFILRLSCKIRILRVMGLLIASRVFVGWRIIGLGTSCFATPIIPTRLPTRTNSNSPNWVGAFLPFVQLKSLLFLLGGVQILSYVHVMCGL